MGKQLVIRIHELLREKNISLRELARLSDIRPEALSKLSNQKRQSITRFHIEKIAEALEITDIREILERVDTDE